LTFDGGKPGELLSLLLFGGSVLNLLKRPPRAPAACETVAGTLQLADKVGGGLVFLEAFLEPEEDALGVSWK
jgi:hypothetical protein